MFSNLHRVYDLVGGDKFFIELADVFYNKIDNDDLLRGMFPTSLEEAKKWNYLFLRKIFGGPDEYVTERGHPMMRKRHFPFKIGLKERNRWYDLMIESIKELGIAPDHPAYPIMQKYFDHMATKMINQPVLESDFR